MAELGWAYPGFLSDNDCMIILDHCITRYVLCVQHLHKHLLIAILIMFSAFWILSLVHPGPSSSQRSTLALRGTHTNSWPIGIKKIARAWWISEYRYVIPEHCMFLKMVSTPSNDKVEEDHLATAFDIICHAWIVRCTTSSIHKYTDVYPSL